MQKSIFFCQNSVALPEKVFKKRLILYFVFVVQPLLHEALLIGSYLHFFPYYAYCVVMASGGSGTQNQIFGYLKLAER